MKPPEYIYTSFNFNLFLNAEVPDCFDSPVRNGLSKSPLEDIRKANDSEVTAELIRNIPGYLDYSLRKNSDYQFRRIRQFSGFAIDLSSFSGAKDYMTEKISNRGRSGLRRKKRLLGDLGELKFETYFGPFERSTYDILMTQFKTMLQYRFKEKGIANRDLGVWDEISDYAFRKICDKKALLKSILLNGTPIQFNLCFVSGDILFGHIQGFDSRYIKYSLLDLSIEDHLDWCFANGIKVFDFSMGENQVKRRWSNHIYEFHHLVRLNRRSFSGRLKVLVWIAYFQLLQFLRDRGILGGRFSVARLRYVLGFRR